jgi:serine/threonine protein kinase
MLKEGASDADKDEFMSEAALMSQFQHKNVVSLVGVVTAGEPRLLLVQLCENGALLSFLKSRTGFNKLLLEHKLAIILDVASGMKYLAGLRVVHRDLAARNVLVSADFICKVAGFFYYCVHLLLRIMLS